MPRRCVVVLVVIALVGLGAGLLVTGALRARAVAERMACHGHFSQTALALHNYAAGHNDAFPAGTIPHPDLPPDQRLSWWVSVLPYVEQNNVYTQFDLRLGPGDARNAKATSSRWQNVVCPSSGEYDRNTGEWKSPTPLTHTAVPSLRNGEENEELFKVALAPGEAPYRIDLTKKHPAEGEAEQVMRGIYELKSDTLKICVTYLTSEEKDRPAELKAGEGQVFLVLERIKDEKEELKALAGEWKGVKMNLAGKDVSADELATLRWVVDGAEVLLARATEKGAKATIRLDPAAAPPTIDWTVKEGEKTVTLVGIYFRQENKLTACFADHRVKDATRPTELKPGDGRVFLALERVPKK